MGRKNDAEGAADLSTAIYTCAVLLRDFKEKLSEKAVAGCGEMVQEVVTQWLQSDSDYLLSSAIEAVLPEIVRWVSCEDLSADWENPLYWVIGILLEHRETFSSCIANILWKQDQHAALKVLYTYVHLFPIYRKNTGSMGKQDG